jgi:hypothetical protein
LSEQHQLVSMIRIGSIGGESFRRCDSHNPISSL